MLMLIECWIKCWQTRPHHRPTERHERWPSRPLGSSDDPSQRPGRLFAVAAGTRLLANTTTSWSSTTECSATTTTRTLCCCHRCCCYCHCYSRRYSTLCLLPPWRRFRSASGRQAALVLVCPLSCRLLWLLLLLQEAVMWRSLYRCWQLLLLMLCCWWWWWWRLCCWRMRWRWWRTWTVDASSPMSSATLRASLPGCLFDSWRRWATPKQLRKWKRILATRTKQQCKKHSKQEVEEDATIKQKETQQCTTVKHNSNLQHREHSFLHANQSTKHPITPLAYLVSRWAIEISTI